MNTVQIPGAGVTVLVPSSWEEMTPRQTREIFRIHGECVREGLSPLDFNVRALYFLLGVRKPLFARRDSARDGNVYLLCERLLGFLFDGDSATLSFRGVANPMPEARAGAWTLHGPGDLLRDLTFGEFRHAAVAVNRFFAGGAPADLDEALAFLYRVRCRKPNRAGRRVPDMTNGNARRHIRRVSGLAPWRKNLIMMWFASCLEYLQGGTVEIDGEEIRLAVLFAPEGGSPSGPGFGWGDLLVELAKEGMIGNIDRVDEEPLFSVLSILWHNYKESKRNEQASKTAKAH